MWMGQPIPMEHLEKKMFIVFIYGELCSFYQFVVKKPKSVKFELSGETDGIFELLPTEGKLQTRSSLDWEKKKEHRLQIKTVNSDGQTEEGPFNILIIVEDINDQRPVFNQSEYVGQVREKYRPDNVRWNDDDVLYVLSQRDKYLRLPFTISENGDIYVVEQLDREERSEYIFYAVAKSRNGLFMAWPLTIVVNVLDINDNSPVCPANITAFEVQENENIGSTIGEFRATDNDQEGTYNSQLKYRLVEQTPTIPSKDMFLLNEYTGDLQLIKGGLNIKEVNQYLLKVEVSDNGKPALKTVCQVMVNVIDINDNIPIFERSDYGNLTIPEDTALNRVVIEIQATDSDQPLTGSSFIIYQIMEGDPHKMFSIDTDKLTNRGYVKILKTLDYESIREHRLVIQATNPEPLITGINYNDSSVTKVTIFVTNVDERPYFTQTLYQAQCNEDVAIGTKIGTVEAIDPEGDKIRFALQEDKWNWLRINETSGEIFTNNVIDREKEGYYPVQIIASEMNNPHMSSLVLFHLYLKDVNDNPPRLADRHFKAGSFCYPLTKPGSLVIEATDDDLQHLRPFGFKLPDDENTLKDWEIKRINGTHATLSMKHTRFEMRSYNVPVIINDQGEPPLEATVKVPVLFCSCSSNNKCDTLAVQDSGFPSIGMALGILFGTLAVIGIIIAAVFISINQKKKKQIKADEADARSPVEITPL
ncbi:hypothetical protein GDO86_010849 [Hymenochirus boettgeri]|uniref:Cadherin domain-containing protein n=1 Tax=Hymenochirus boettgeri TaxID=247094 RepID=A0A8T2JDY2_9PIPI|nr:hypothetical protein GDO86_010849 [Hymenochirus boettgeri]